ncbi:chorismate--pyruvate lyase family protein [Candidatus Methylobacter oryzae]|uniref:Probable chorismate pyruvate-lyase n=1 Tax=Candidatus Methylobacter oryzae TaxID=2497749 RepID=A0ABY3CDD6_9GAMM|nr:chorismate lyase [Candidatus Methylobacter oryzae]TRX00656.1 chorismate lyase [Candidatus Methylobacter oryzae]
MPNKSFLFNREPVWLENRPGTRHTLPENVQSWTYEPGSLTQRLRDYYGDAVRVKILLQQWNTPFLSERRLLKLRESRYSLIREVLLYANAKPLILARTIIPAKTIKAAKRNLAHLGNRPLGEVIFSYPKLERIEMDVTLIDLPVWTQPAIAEGRIIEPVRGRRTVYAVAHRQMLVSEFFLPGVLEIF